MVSSHVKNVNTWPKIRHYLFVCCVMTGIYDSAQLGNRTCNGTYTMKLEDIVIFTREAELYEPVVVGARFQRKSRGSNNHEA